MRYQQSFVSLVASALCVALTTTSAIAQSGAASADAQFPAKVMKALESRDKFRTGKFTYTLDVKLPGDDQVRSRQKGTFAFDYDSGHTFHHFKLAERVEGEVAPVDKVQELAGGSLRTPDFIIFFPHDGQRGTKFPIQPNQHVPTMPFEFRTFGHGFFGDYQRKSSFEEVLAGYLEWHDPTIVEEKEGVIKYDSGEVDFELDTRRDFWITKLEFLTTRRVKAKDGEKPKTRKAVMSKCEMQLEKVEGLLAPSDVKYSSESGGLHHIKIDWELLNAPLPKDQFEPATIQGLVKKSL